MDQMITADIRNYNMRSVLQQTTTIAAKLAVVLAVTSAAVVEDIKAAAAGPIPTQKISAVFALASYFSAPR